MLKTYVAAIGGLAIATTAAAADISGAGATFPAPVYAKWAEAYKAQTCAGLNYQDVTFSDITNVNQVPAYVIGNAMVGYEARTWGVTVNIDNVTNERYFVAANGAGAFVGDPLSAFINVHFKQ